jgi:hypothetical protein
VRHPVFSLVLGSVLVSLAAAVVLGAGVVRASLVLQIYAVVLAALGLLAAVRLTRAAHPATPRHPLGVKLRRRRRADERPPDLESLERVIAIAAEDVFFLERRLLPVLRDVAEHRLRSRGTSLERERGRELCGPELTELLERRPERRLPLAELRAHLDRLEAI